MRLFLVYITALYLSTVLPAQQDACTLRIRVALIDKDLNVKPVPKLTVNVLPSDSKSSFVSLALTTSFDGTVDAKVPRGKYRLVTPRSVDFQGKGYTWDVLLSLTEGETKIDLSVDNAIVTESTPEGTAPIKDELIGLFKKYQDSVVTVWSETGHGTGFIVDSSGLVLTNQHVIGLSEYIAVQFDETKKVRATLLAQDPEKDVAVLWVNLSSFPVSIVAPVVETGGTGASVEEGERVFTIGSPLSQRKILTTGIVSKVEARAIISDININPGNSGGPLFSSRGKVVGLTTFAEQTGRGPGIAGIVRIEQVYPVLAQAEGKMAATPRPSPAYLPVEPTGMFPLDAIKGAALAGNFKAHEYVFNEGDYNVAVITPILKYQLMEATKVAAAKEKAKRTNKKDEAIKGTFQPLDELRNWAEYAGEYHAVVEIRASPMLRETFASALGRGLASYGGQYAGPAKMRFKTDFYKMRLLCGSKEVSPIQPGKVANVVSQHNTSVNVTDATYEGYYSYPPDAISPNCGSVSLVLYSEKDPQMPVTRVLDPKIVQRVWSDFEPYRKAQANSSVGDPLAKH